MTRLDRIKIEGFKSIKAVDIELRDLNILIGPNGAGKSNFISVFEFLNNIVNENLQVYVGKAGGDRLLHFGGKHTDRIELHIWFKPNQYEIFLEATEEDSLLIANEVVYFHKLPHTEPWDERIGTGSKESKLKERADEEWGGHKVAKHVLEALESWKIFHFHDTSDSSKMKKSSDINDNSFLRRDGSNLAAFLYFLKEKHPGIYRNIVDTIRLVAPFFDDFTLAPSRLNNDQIMLEWKQVGTDAYFNASSLSDGTLRFMCLTTLLLQPDPPSTIIIDEPELGLHPYAISILSEMMKAASKRTQVIVSTQSVTLVNHFNPEDIVVVEMQNNETSMRRLEKDKLEEWMQDYSIGELWEKNVFGGRP